MSVAARSSSARRNWGTDDSQAEILHVDMDSFFASVELLERSDLVGSPVVVGGTGTRGVVTSATYEARGFGIHAGMPIGRARSLCPSAIFLPGRHSLYKEYSGRVMQILSEVSEAFEPLSIDEAFLDVSGARRRLGSPVEIAIGLRLRIKRELGLPASVGIASVKSVAKIASAHAKPDGLLLVPASQTVNFLHSLPIGALWGVGKQTEKTLVSKGIDTVADLAHTDISMLRRWLGDSAAIHLKDLSWGKDPRPVSPREREKSVSTESTFSVNVTSQSALERFILDASHQCARRLRELSLLGWTVTVKLRDKDFATITRSRTLTAPTDVGRQVATAALKLVRAQPIPRGGIRLAGVGVSGLVGIEEGIPTLLDEDPRDRDAELAMDLAVEKFGKSALLPASLLTDSRGESARLRDISRQDGIDGSLR